MDVEAPGGWVPPPSLTLPAWGSQLVALGRPRVASLTPAPPPADTTPLQ